MKRIGLAAFLILLGSAPQEAKFALEKGDRICILGNTLAERMQHDGWLEAVIQARFPRNELVFRNLGFSGDEVTLRLRSSGFGSPDHWLGVHKADVIFAFFGYNESFAGEAGLGKFRKDLEGFVKSALGQKYNGKGAPRMVLFSPIAHENLRDPDLPDGSAGNKRLELYTQAMADVAKAGGTGFVDLFHPTLKAYGDAKKPLTLNGVHLNEEGNRRVAGIIDGALFGEAPARDLEKLRQAVIDKDWHWYQRYRTTDGYSIYGGRADLKFIEGQTNRVVMQRELEILDVMTANRDPRIWAIAQGGDLKVDDSNTPPFVGVRTNRPGPGPSGAHLFLSGEDAISKMEVHPGMKVNLYASEEKFPELAKPVQMAFDTRGRLWVAAWPSYPHWKPKDEMNDKLLILEDTDGDGKADVCKTFADKLRNPTGFEFYGGGVIVAQAPDLMFLKDTNGDDKADVRERILHGLDTADTHHTANSFVLDPGGALYMQEGTFHHTQVESPWGPSARCANGGVFRYEPRTHKFDVYVSYGFANPHGHVFDRWGQDFVTDGTSEETYYGLTFSGHVDFPRKHAKPPRVLQPRTRPCPATEILSSRHFPEEHQGNLLIANVIGVLGVLQYKVSDKGSGFAATETKPIVLSSDPNFRPADVEIGADGAIYFTDWQNPIIGHMQHNLRDPSRDQKHGRVYRVTYAGRSLSKPASVAGQPVEKLLELLKDPENRVRYRAKIELSGRKTEEVIPAVRKWMAELDKNDSEYPHHLMEALWMHQYHNRVNEDLLKQMLRSSDFRARAASTRVLRGWRDRVAKPLELLAVQANDEHPRVRLESLVACSFFPEGNAAGVALEVLKRPRDEFIDYCLKETMTSLEAHWKPALKEGKLQISSDNPAAAEYLLGSVGTADLAKLPRTPAVLLALLSRHGVPETARREAAAALAKERGADEAVVLLDVIGRIEAGTHRAHVIQDLTRLLFDRPADELRRASDRIKALARDGGSREARQAGYAAWVTVTGSAGEPFAAASASEAGLGDFITAIPLIASPELRGSLYPKVRPLFAFLESKELKPGVPPAGSITVDYFEVAPKNVAIETLAKLKPKATGIAKEISLKVPQIQRRDAFALRFTGTLQVPRAGEYTFFIASDDGSRLYINGKQVIDHDGLHGMSEKSGTVSLQSGPQAIVVTYFDNGGDDGLAVSWQGPGLAKQPLAGGALVGEAPETVQQAVIRILDSIPGHDRDKFEDLGALIRAGKVGIGAFEAIRRIDKRHWPPEQARPLINVILAYATSLPADLRTSPEALDALRFGQDLAPFLPAEEAQRATAMLKNLDVNIIVIRPVPHQMVFDRRQIVVEAGKAVEILFQNTDIMPHNLVITAPGAMAEVGMLAEQMGIPGEAKAYVPETSKVLWATRLLLPGQSQKLQFTAPKTPGAYPYVCTFPGHWLIMNGVMQVVEKGAAPRLVEAPPEPQVPSRKFVKMWTLAELEGDAKGLSGRSFPRGKEMFAAAGCVKCHTFGGEGSRLGPDLTKASEKYRGAALLKQILEPSTEINEQFKAWVIQTHDGEVLSGLIVKEDDKEVHLLANLLNANDVKVLPKSRISARKASTLSSMPTGMLVTLEKDEILDLVAFIESGGDPKNKLFK